MITDKTLNKRIFWDEMKALYPAATQHFLDWIDEYKKLVDWKALFNSDSEYQNADGKNAPAPKFHDLPFYMQLGIVTGWLIDANGQNGFLFIPENLFHNGTSFDNIRVQLARIIKQFNNRLTKTSEDF